jgi:hypothetical protein
MTSFALNWRSDRCELPDANLATYSPTSVEVRCNLVIASHYGVDLAKSAVVREEIGSLNGRTSASANLLPVVANSPKRRQSFSLRSPMTFQIVFVLLVTAVIIVGMAIAAYLLTQMGSFPWSDRSDDDKGQTDK